MIKFSEFIAVFEYLIERLKKNAIIKENGDYKDISFLFFAAEIKQSNEAIEEVLNFFSGNDNRYKYKQNDVITKHTKQEIRVPINPIQFFNHYYQNQDEIVIEIKDYKDTKTDFLLQLFENLRLIAQDEIKRKLFEKFIAKIKELQTQGLLHNTLVPEFRDSKLAFIFHEYSGLESEFKPELWQFAKDICNERRLLPSLKNCDERYGETCDGKHNSTAEMNYLRENAEKNFKARSDGGKNSHSKTSSNIELRKIVQELILKYSASKTYFEDKNRFYDAVYEKLESDYYDTLKDYSAYKKYLQDENIDWQRTIKDWCRAFIKKENIKLNIKKTQKKDHRKS